MGTTTDLIETTLYSPGVLRLHRMIDGHHVEVSCVRAEYAACHEWIRASDLAAPLPFLEHRCARWGPWYRWTLAAAQRWIKWNAGKAA